MHHYMKPLLRLLLLEQLVPHGKEGDGQPGAKEEDEVGGQLVPGHGQHHKHNQRLEKIPVVNGEGQVIPWSRQTITSPPVKDDQ